MRMCSQLVRRPGSALASSFASLLAALFAASSVAISVLPRTAFAADNVWDLVNATNQVRAENGLQPLTVNDELTRSAGTHARDMATRNYFSHWTPEGWDAGLRIYGWGYPRWAGVAENIAAGQGSPWQVVQSWLASPGHRANLLNPNFRSFGVGHYYASSSSYVNYWVGHYGTN